jgi:predicted phage terminase large subunit-like protein
MNGNQKAFELICSLATPEEKRQLMQDMRRASKGISNTLANLVQRTVNFPLHSWQKDHLCPLLERLRDERGLRIAIHAPPRWGKSILVSQRLPAYLMGENPGVRIGLVTHNIAKSVEFGKVIRDLMALDPTYAQMYPNPDCRVSPDSPQNNFSTSFRRKQRDGQPSFVGMGLHQGFVGKGYELVIIDDPYAPLSADTPIATPDGWTTMGELHVGDHVFDYEGKPTLVTNITQRWAAPRHRVWFSDYSYIDSHPDHMWKAFDRNCHGVYTNTKPTRYKRDWINWATRGKSSVSKVSTKEIMGSLIARKTMRNWTIPTTFALDLPSQALPIDPWVLGYWLGNGHSCGSSFTMHEYDSEYVESRVCKAGYFVRSTQHKGDTHSYTIGVSTVNNRGNRWGADSLTKRLKDLGVRDNKHIPMCYLRGSYEQRLELLRGLLDSDGNAATRDGEVTFVNVNENLAQGVHELIVSLGGKARLRTRKQYGLSKDPDAWHFTVTSYPPFQPFGMPRKAALYDPIGQIRRVNRTITDVEVLEETEHLCITVDSPSHMFLAGRSMVPTCNSSAQALSGVINAKLINLYTTDIKLRMAEDSNIIIMFHRYHDNDLAGYLIENEGFESVRFPAIADENEDGDDPTGRSPGELLSPMRTREYLEEIKESDIFAFMGQFQGKPMPESGGFFNTDKLNYCSIADLPPNLRIARGWDLAATQGGGDWTVGTKMGIGPDNRVYVIDMYRDRVSTDKVDKAIVDHAHMDGIKVPIVIPEDPGAAGKKASAHIARLLTGFDFTLESTSGQKWVRAKPFSSQVNGGNVTLVEAGWNKKFVKELGSFIPENNAGIDDIVDSASSCYALLAKRALTILTSEAVSTTMDLSTGTTTQQEVHQTIQQDSQGRPIPIRRFYVA